MTVNPYKVARPLLQMTEQSLCAFLRCLAHHRGSIDHPRNSVTDGCDLKPCDILCQGNYNL
jgi:hypothetical protein